MGFLDVNSFLRRKEISLIISRLHRAQGKPLRWKDFRKTFDNEPAMGLSDTEIGRGLKDLMHVGFVGKNRKGGYKLTGKCKTLALNEAARFTDRFRLSGYPSNRIIHNQRSTLYGLESTNLLVDQQLRFFLRPDDMFTTKQGIFAGKMKSSISIWEALQIINDKVIQIKKAFRLKALDKAYEMKLTDIRGRIVKVVLRRFKNELLSFLNHCDIGEGWVDETLRNPLSFYGRGVSDKLRSELLATAITNLNKKDKTTFRNFLLYIVRICESSYPTAVTVVTNSSIGLMIEDFSKMEPLLK